VDAYFFSKESDQHIQEEIFSFEGKMNLLLLLCSIILSFLPIPILLRSISLVFLGGVSFYITPLKKRHKWGFNMHPFLEIFYLFIGIFLTMAPIVEVLKLQSSVLLKILNSPSSFFWTTGILSGILDNAPTYLVFFHIAGGDAQDLMTANSLTLTAISLGAVFMGALTYIGNAPNLMVRSIAHHRGAHMPHFFGYMLWSCGILLPLFWLIQKLFLEQ
jgi:Na+/H+ antiporter NhaD/arsenite permease-like protein